MVALSRHRLAARRNGALVRHLSRLLRKIGARAVDVGLGVVDGLVASRGHHRHALAVRVVERALRRLDDRPLLGLVGGRVSRVVGAVEQPGIDVVAHVDHVDPDVAGVGERIDGRLQEEEAGVLARADVDDGDVRRDTGDA